MLQARSSAMTCPLLMSQVTPSHKQQSVPSFHDSVLGFAQYSKEAEGSMRKDSLNWSRWILWSRAHNWAEEEKFEDKDEETVGLKCKRNKIKDTDWVNRSKHPIFSFSIQNSGRWMKLGCYSTRVRRKSKLWLVLFIDSLIVRLKFLQ